MPRPRKPQWVVPGPGRPGRFRTVIDGELKYFPTSIGQHDRPQLAGIPVKAWEHLRHLEQEAKARISAGSDPTVYWLCQLYLAWAEREASEGQITPEQYAGQVSRLKLFLGHPGLAQTHARLLGVETLEEFFEGLRRAPGGSYSAHYIAGIGRTVRTVFRWGAKPIPGRVPLRLLPENPLAGYDFPRAPKAVRGYVEGAVIRRFLRWAWGRARGQPGLYRRFDRIFVLMLRFQHLTGCRPGEACSLLWTDIDWAGGKAVIPKERHKTGKKTGRDRVIYLTPPVARLLRVLDRLEDRHPDYVFTHRRGNNAIDRGHLTALGGEPWPSGSAASSKVADWREEAMDEAKRLKTANRPTGGLEAIEGIGPRKLVAYVNRHRYVSNAVSSGLSHEQTASLVGNSAEVIRQVYAHTIEQADAGRAGKLVERGRGGRRPTSDHDEAS